VFMLLDMFKNPYPTSKHFTLSQTLQVAVA
jgi:hypothetical protein